MPQLNCLDNYITLRGICTAISPVSGKYFNDLAGVDLRGLGNMTDEQQVSFKGMFDEIYRRSINEIEGDIQVRMQKFFKTKNLLENIYTGGILNELQAEASSNSKKGVAIDLNGSKNMQIFINHVDLYTVSAITDKIRIYDYGSGVLLDEISYTSEANKINRIAINKAYDCFADRRKIFITYNGNLTNSIQTSVLSYYEEIPYHPIVRGASLSNSSSVIESNLTFDSNTFGLSANFNVVCSLQNFICSIKDYLTMPLMYKLGENYMLERLTTRVLSEDTFDPEGTEKLRVYYNTKYSESMDSVLQNMNPEGDDVCFPCEKRRNYKFQLP